MKEDRAACAAQAWAIMDTADCLYDESAVDHALDTIAKSISDVLRESNPIVMVVLQGALVFAGHLLSRLDFPLEVDYVHATRYNGALTGGNLNWVAGPSLDIKGRVVLLLDDILDEGVTLARLSQQLLEIGAARVLKAVLVTKERVRPLGLEADFSGLNVPDRYVFGWGMDYEGYLRNARGIYAVR